MKKLLVVIPLAVMLMGAGTSDAPAPAQKALIDLRALRHTAVGAADPAATYQLVKTGKDTWKLSMNGANPACAPGVACQTLLYRVEGACKISEIHQETAAPDVLMTTSFRPTTMAYLAAMKGIPPSELGSKPVTLISTTTLDFRNATAEKGRDGVQFRGDKMVCESPSIEGTSAALRVRIQSAAEKSPVYYPPRCVDSQLFRLRGGPGGAYVEKLVALAATSGCFKPLS